MVKYTLNYFSFAGRAETVRLLFHAAGVEFTDNRMTLEQWQENKPDCKLPGVTVPRTAVPDIIIA